MSPNQRYKSAIVPFSRVAAKVAFGLKPVLCFFHLLPTSRYRPVDFSA